MKKGIKKTAVATILLLLSILSEAGTIHAFVSSQMPPKARAQVYQDTIGYALEMEPGTTLNVYCGNTLELIASLPLPDYEFYRKSKKKRVEKMAGGIKDLRRWSESTPDKREAFLSLDVPRIFRHVRENVTRDETGNVLLLMGSPVVTSVGEAFSMKDGVLPSDSHVRVSAQESPYSLAGAENKLEGFVVRWAHLKDATGENVHYTAALRRWWALVCAYQGASLASYEVSLKNTLKAVDSGKTEAVCLAIADYESGLSMVKALEAVRAKVEEPVVAEIPVVEKGLEFLSTTELSTEPLKSLTLGSARFGISWSGTHDLDICVKAHPSAEEISFRKPSTPEGKHLKDHLTSPGKDAYEIIELGPCDLAKVELSVNLFAVGFGKKPIKATVRIEANGQVFSQEIEFNSDRGNGGADRDGNRAESHYWVVLDPLKICGLR